MLPCHVERSLPLLRDYYINEERFLDPFDFAQARLSLGMTNIGQASGDTAILPTRQLQLESVPNVQN